MHVVFLHGVFHIFLQIVLDRGVYGQNHAVAVGGLIVLLKGIGHLRLIVALGGDDLTGRALQHAVVIGLDALGSHVAGVGEADDLGRQGRVGIRPLGIRLHVNPNDIVFHNEIPDLRRDLVRLLGGQHFIAHVDICGLLPNPRRVQVQDPAQRLRHQIQVHLVVMQLLRIQKYIFHAGGHGHNVHVPVVNIAPGGGDGGGSGLVVQRFFRILVVAEYHQIGEHSHHRQKCDNAAQD